jgi:hypothetical protein
MEITHHQISMWIFLFYILMDFFYFSVPTNVLGLVVPFLRKRLTTCPPAVKLGTLIRQDIL